MKPRVLLGYIYLNAVKEETGPFIPVSPHVKAQSSLIVLFGAITPAM